jgi:acyl carrier protein/nodulation protein F
MDQIAQTALAIFEARAGSAREVGLETPLSALRIESLDLALILLDLEDAFGIDFPYDPGRQGDAFATVGDVVARVRALVEAKRQHQRPVSPAAVHGRSLWLAAFRA